MSNGYLISIIVTCYNNGKYIKRCLDSLIQQNDNSFEVIIVNDGSSDNSVEIINDCINGLNNFKLLQQCNSGVSSARNTGISNATGNYICFIDGDDYVSREYISKIKTYIANKIDIIQFNVKDKEYTGTVWSKCIKKDLIVNNDIKFLESANVGEDLNFCEKLLVFTSSISYYNDFIYIYEVNDSSASGDLDKRFTIYTALDDLIHIVNTNDFNYPKERLNRIIYKHGIIYPLLLLKQNKLDKNLTKEYKKVIDRKRQEYSNYLSLFQKVKVIIYLYVYYLFFKLKVRKLIIG